MKIKINPQNIALYLGCALYLSLLAIEVEKSHCPGEVLLPAANAILTHSAQSIVQKRHTCQLTTADRVRTLFWFTDQVRTL